MDVDKKHRSTIHFFHFNNQGAQGRRDKTKSGEGHEANKTLEEKSGRFEQQKSHCLFLISYHHYHQGGSLVGASLFFQAEGWLSPRLWYGGEFAGPAGATAEIHEDSV